MTEEEKKLDTEEPVQEESADTAAQNAEEAEDAAQEEASAEEKAGSKKKEEKKYKSKCAALEKEAAEIKAKLEEERDAHLRVAAEYDNFRKRSQKEKEGIYSDAVSDTVKELLPLFDNLDLAASYTDGEKVADGLALILKSVPDVLAKLKIEPFGEAGETFDPNLHDAMMHEENGEYGENQIMEVFRKGYRIGDKIIRHALVKVAN